MAILSLGALSCTRELNAPEQVPGGAQVVTLGAALDQTKAAISDNAVFSWQAGDAMSVATTAGFVDFDLSDGAGKPTATFKGYLEQGVGLGTVAVYPAGKHTVSGSDVTVNLPAEYVFAEDNTNIPLLGAIADGNVKFTAIGGVARFKAGMPAGAAKVVLSTDKKITGDFTVANGAIAAGEGADKVVYTFEAVAEPKNMTFNFPLPVGEYAMTFTVEDASGNKLAELAGSKAHAITAGNVLIFKELAFEEKSVVLNNDKSFATIQEAIDAAAALTEGTAEIVLTGEDYEEAVKIDGSKVAVPVVLDGQNTATLVGGIEIYKNAATIKNLKIKVAATSLKTLPGTYLNDANAGYAFGIQVNVPGHGAVIEGNTIDNVGLTNSTCIYFANIDAESGEGDLVKGNTIIAEEQRGMQAYGSIRLVENEITSHKYPIRIGGPGSQIVIDGNTFKANATCGAAVDIHGTLKDATVTFGDGVADNNKYGANFTNKVKGTDGGNVTYLPAEYATHPVVNAVTVELNGAGYPSLQAAVNAAAALTSGIAEIKIVSGSSLTEEVKITGNAGDKDLNGNELPAVKVPVVIDGIDKAATTLTGSIEVSRVPVTIKNLKVVSTENSKVSLAGTYTNSAWTTAIHGSVGGYGLVVNNVEVCPGIANATGIWIGSKDENSKQTDVIEGCVINNEERAIQAYATDVQILDNTFNDYTKNIIRIGNDGASYGAKYSIVGNTFTSAGTAINFYNIDNSKVWIADNAGVAAGNDLGSAKMTANVTLAEKNNVIVPALAQEGNDVTIAAEGGPLTRVWAKWNAFDNSWDDAICDPAANNWDRHAAVVGQYLYVPSASRTETKVAVFDVLTGEHVSTITEGFNAEYGLFKLCSIAKLGEAIYVSSMSNSGKLAIYKLTENVGGKYTKAELALAIDVPAGERLGDDMTSVGDDEEGSLIFVSYSTTGATEDRTRLIWEFPVLSGQVIGTPVVAPRGVTAGGNFIGGLYIYEYTGSALGQIYSEYKGTGGERHGIYCSNVGGTGYVAWTWGIDPYGSKYPAILEQNVMAPRFLTIGEQKYFMYVSAPSKQGYLRLVPITGDNYKAGFEALCDVTDLTPVSTVYPLVVPGNPAGVGPTGTNGTGFCDYTTIDGVTYVVAGATENGWSCFKFN